MPFGLPGLSAAEHRVLTRWLEQGAPYEGPAAPTPLATQRVAQWERFFNGDSLKERLFSRYAYEHLFLAHLYFDDDPERQYFRLVRSATPPGQPPRLIASPPSGRRPGRGSRLLPARPRARDHRRQDAHALRPGCAADGALARAVPRHAGRGGAPAGLQRGDGRQSLSPPSRTCRSRARYRFMLDEAEFTIMGFIKGPVCRGQMALNVIEDRFWVVFLAPSSGSDAAQAALLARDVNLLRLPTGSSSTPVLIPWLQYAKLENEYLKAKSECARAVAARLGPPGPAPDLGRRRPQRQRRAHRLPALRQRQRRQGHGRRSAEDGVGHRLPAARAHPLPAGRQLRRLRQRRTPAQLAALHGLPAHGGRVQLPHPAAPGAASRDAGPLVPRRQPRHARAGLRRPDDDAGRGERHPLSDERPEARAARHDASEARAGAEHALRHRSPCRAAAAGAAP